MIIVNIQHPDAFTTVAVEVASPCRYDNNENPWYAMHADQDKYDYCNCNSFLVAYEESDVGVGAPAGSFAYRYHTFVHIIGTAADTRRYQ